MKAAAEAEARRNLFLLSMYQRKQSEFARHLEGQQESGEKLRSLGGRRGAAGMRRASYLVPGARAASLRPPPPPLARSERPPRRQIPRPRGGDD